MLDTKELDAKLAIAENSTLASKLSPKELYYCELLSRGSPPIDAYVKSHPQSKSVINNNRIAISVASSRLRDKSSVAAYLASLSQQSTLDKTLSREGKRARLAELVSTCLDPAIVLRAIEIDNKMMGHEAPKTTVSLSPSLAIADKLLSGLASRPELPSPKPVAAIQPSSGVA